MSFDLQGKIIKIDDVQTFNSGFTKREFVVKTDENYPQDIKFELVKDKTSLIEKFQLGDDVKVSFDVRGSEWNGKYFVNLNAWRIESAGAGSGQAAPATQGSAAPVAPPPGDAFDPGDAAEDDLPF